VTCNSYSNSNIFISTWFLLLFRNHPGMIQEVMPSVELGLTNKQCMLSLFESPTDELIDGCVIGPSTCNTSDKTKHALLQVLRRHHTRHLVSQMKEMKLTHFIESFDYIRHCAYVVCTQRNDFRRRNNTAIFREVKNTRLV